MKMNENLNVQLPEMTCEVCGKPAQNVYASKYGPCTLSYCEDCMNNKLEPYWIVVAYIACAGHFPEDINEWYQKDVRRMLAIWEKSEDEFIQDVENALEDQGDISYEP
jgi:hypothetical protein